MDYYFTKDDEYLTSCPENVTFRELHFCSEKKFNLWVDAVVRRIKSKWYQQRTPIHPGNFSAEDIVTDMKNLSVPDVSSQYVK